MSQSLEDYEVLGIIGRGSSGTCYKVRNKFSKELYAWKAVDYGNLTEDNKQLLVSEVNLLRALNHPNILKYCGKILHKETTTLYIITEWCEGGDLSRVIKGTRDKGKYFEEEFIWRILYQLSRAIQVCHSRLRNFTIFHRDIKPANVFLDSQGNAKLGDFGLARIVQPEKEYSETIVGTPYYMSPELIKGHKYNRKSDIWALGCLIYELCALIPPFNGSNIMELADTIKSGKYKSIPSRYSDNMKKVISFMLSTKHEFRPTIEMILHHPSVVINVKPHAERVSSRQSQAKIFYDESEVNKSLNSELVNLTLVDPEIISNKVFKDKLAEKHEALKEKEAWLKKREQNLGQKERFLANREKQLLQLERQARQKQYFADLQMLKRKEMAAAFHESGHETDISLEPGETPVRPTSAKLDPILLPRPDILTNACKKLEELERKASNFNVSCKQLGENNTRSKEPSKTRRSLILDVKKPNVKNKLNVKFPKSEMNYQTVSSSNTQIIHGFTSNQCSGAINVLKERQKASEEIKQKINTFKKESNKTKCNKENIQRIKTGDTFKISQQEHKNNSGTIRMII